MRAFLSIIGLLHYDSTLFDEFNVPVGMDRDTAIKKILFDNAELGLIYTDPKTAKDLITMWCAVNLPNWQRAYDALMAEYNPIYNYNRLEDWTDDSTGNTEDIVATLSADQRKVAGFNENSKLVNESEIDSGQYSNGTGSKTDKNIHSGNIRGNIGVKTTQSMIQEEWDIRAKLNVYDMISNSFKSTFCVMVYGG